MADTVELMRKRVLDMATRGELVEQRKEEGPASNVFLEKNKILCSNDVPFDIPKNWEWVTLNDIGTWGAGATPARGNPAYWTNGTIPWIKTGELNNGEIWNSEERITELALEKTSVKVNQPEDILIAMYGATIGKLGILKFEATTNQACCACTPFEGMNNKYLFYFLMSHREKFIEGSEGGAQPNISKTKIINTPFPLPPTQEQNRIVAKIEEILAVIDQIGTKKEEALLIIRNMRQTALQDAIMGLLVEQDETDESASELYAKIKNEKESLTKIGIIKKEKPFPEIESDDIAFEIPESWKWVRLGSLAKKVHYGYTASATEYGNAKMLRITDIQGGRVNWESVPYCEIEENKIEQYKLNDNDIVIARTGGTVGKSFKINKDTTTDSVFASYLIRIILTESDSTNYIAYFLNSPYYWEQIGINAQGTGQPNVNATQLSNLILPLPPLAEQERIVEKLDEIMGICDQMEAILDGSADMVAERIY